MGCPCIPAATCSANDLLEIGELDVFDLFTVDPVQQRSVDRDVVDDFFKCEFSEIQTEGFVEGSRGWDRERQLEMFSSLRAKLIQYGA